MAKKNGRPTEPHRDLVIYEEVQEARKLKRPKHPGLKPVQLSWDKAYEVAQRVLCDEYGIILSSGAIRAAHKRGKKLFDQMLSQGYVKLGPPVEVSPTYRKKSDKPFRPIVFGYK
jgi:hypothetical protein